MSLQPLPQIFHSQNGSATSTFVQRMGLFLAVAGFLTSPIYGQSDFKGVTVQIKSGKKEYHGTPLAWDQSQLALLRTNGRISFIPRDKIDSLKKTSNGFAPLDAKQIRATLGKEFGDKYQVTISEHFVVVHPPGEQKKWVQPFESLYLQFRSYFWARGFAVDTPTFPMVAVVLNSRKEFDRFLENYVYLDSRIQGYYSPTSNRVITYSGSDSEQDNFFQKTTLVHEATHQVAFNTGIHSRIAPAPRWVTEGLAMMFESKGVYNSQRYPDLADRYNESQLLVFRQGIKAGEMRGKLQTLVDSDDWFKSEPEAAYAYAWALSFYLMENRPNAYTSYLKALNEKPGFVAYPAADRRAEFEKYFGRDYNELELRAMQFLTK
ncbi:MAG: DUF1570 domain-containing protein [Pirellulaceae bacterium]